MKRIRYLSLLVMLLCGITAVAQDDFNPADPTEPGQMPVKLILECEPVDGGSAGGGGKLVPGETASLYAYPSQGFEFVNWTNSNGEVVSANASFTYTVGNAKETLTAHFAFNPDSPTEPDELPSRLKLIAEEGGSVYGAGVYKNGETANISASPYSLYEFAGWYYSDGTEYMGAEYPETSFTMGSQSMTLIARFNFNPDSPAEPSQIDSRHRLTVVAEEGGYVSLSSKSLLEGESTTVSASYSYGYEFAGWYQGDTKLSDDSEYEFTMGAQNVTLTAHFNFVPDSPNEPEAMQQRRFSFSLKNVITKPGTTVQFPILLTPQATLKDMTFQLNFSKSLNVNPADYVLAETTTAYTVSYEEVENDDYDSYKFTLTGGSIEVNEGDVSVVTPILTFPIVIPEDAETATSHQITINQILMTNEDDTQQSAGTRNGRVSVYKRGDTNGDNTVNAIDVVNIATVALDKTSEIFIGEVSDINEDGKYDATDVLGVATIALNEE